jgi:hypothetical protein
MKLTSRFGLSLLALIVVTSVPSFAQDWVRTGSGLGAARIRLAAADFKQVGADPQTPALKATFDSTLFSDLQNAGIFDMVSKSFNPQGTPGSQQEINLSQWSADPANAAMVAFGALSAANGRLTVYGWLDDARNTGNPQVLGKQYNEAATEDMARTVAHRFADEIILRLGGGVSGIAETKIYFISNRLRRPESARRHAPRQHLALTPHRPRQLPHCFRHARQTRMVHPYVLAGTEPPRLLPRRNRRRQQHQPRMVR